MNQSTGSGRLDTLYEQVLEHAQREIDDASGKIEELRKSLALLDARVEAAKSVYEAVAARLNLEDEGNLPEAIYDEVPPRLDDPEVEETASPQPAASKMRLPERPPAPAAPPTVPPTIVAETVPKTVPKTVLKTAPRTAAPEALPHSTASPTESEIVAKTIVEPDEVPSSKEAASPSGNGSTPAVSAPAVSVPAPAAPLRW